PAKHSTCRTNRLPLLPPARTLKKLPKRKKRPKKKRPKSRKSPRTTKLPKQLPATSILPPVKPSTPPTASPATRPEAKDCPALSRRSQGTCPPSTTLTAAVKSSSTRSSSDCRGK